MHSLLVPSDKEIQIARDLILRYGWNTMAYQILNPGISLWFSALHDAVIGYVQTRTHYIVAGSPVAAEEHTHDVAVEFYRYVSGKGKKVCFFGAQQRIASILSHHAPVSSVLLGAQPIWTPAEWIETVQSKQSLRAQIYRAKNKQVTTHIIGPDLQWDDGITVVPELERVLSEWIASRPLPPMHFLVEPDTLQRLEDRVVVIAAMEKRIIGFCIASPIPLRNGWLIEQIVRGNDAPNGTAELLLDEMIRRLHIRGAAMVTLGLSPLSRHYHTPFEHPVWLKTLLNFTRLYGRYFYNFDGLDMFKAKFLPVEWEPVYAVTNEQKPTLTTLYAIATAFSGMSPVGFVLKGLMKSAVRIR